MAKIKSQSIPPSLLADYCGLLTTPKKYKKTGMTMGIKPGTRQALKPPQTSELLRCHLAAASWLVDQWNPHFGSQFYSDRLSEMKANVFDPQYWYTLTPIRDRTERGFPTIEAYERPVNDQYNDPLRIQSNCIYEKWSVFYDTPLDDGTLTFPAPGWQGTVIDQVWQDQWFAQRRLIYELPVIIEKDDKRPVLMGLDSQVTATATFRGNSIWFARGLWPYFFHEAGTIAPIVNYLMTKWNKGDLYPMDLINTSNDYWQCTNTMQILRDARVNRAESILTPANRLGVIITTPPSRGVYSARNDNVRVTHHEDLAIYVARSPHG